LLPNQGVYETNWELPQYIETITHLGFLGDRKPRSMRQLELGAEYMLRSIAFCIYFPCDFFPNSKTIALAICQGYFFIKARGCSS